MPRPVQGGGGRARARHAEQGKLLVRERIERLADTGSPFLEVGPLAAHDCYDAPTPAAGLVTGVASVSGRLVMVVANDATVKGGTYYPLTVKKHLRAQEIAARCELPCVYLVDSGGAFLPLQAEVFPDRDHFGRIFRNQAVMSARGIPQLAAVMGMCTAGGAYVPRDERRGRHRRGHRDHLPGRPAPGEGRHRRGGESRGTRRRPGPTPSVPGWRTTSAEDDAAAIRILREAVGRLPAGNRSPIRDADPEPPDYPEDEILGIWPRDRRVRVDIRETLARLLDGSRLDEFKARYGTTLVTGFGRIEGITVGIVASNGVLFTESGLKGAHFVQLCAREGLPLLFVQDITGFMVGARYEQGGIAKDGAKMVNAVATAEVPKITLIAGGSFGAGNYAMCGRAYDPAFVWSWPASRISVMGGEQAASVLVQVKRDQRERAGEELSGAEAEEIATPVREKYEREGSPYYATARLWDDGIVDMRNTRRTLALSLAAAANAPVGNSGHGIFRM